GGSGGLRRVRVAPVAGRGGTAIGCDLLAVAGGWNPNLPLFAQAQGRLRFDERLAAFVPDTIDAVVECVGAAAGSFALGDCLAEGAAGGARAALACGFGNGEAPATPAVEEAAEAAPGPLAAPALSRCASRRAFVDLHNDVTAA